MCTTTVDNSGVYAFYFLCVFRAQINIHNARQVIPNRNGFAVAIRIVHKLLSHCYAVH